MTQREREPAYAIKDYLDPGGYPNHNGMNVWRWEFLRRNSDYQAFYALHKGDARMPYCGDFGIRSLYDPMHDDAYMNFLPASRIVGLPTFKWIEQWKKIPGYTAERGLSMILESLTELQSNSDVLVTINRALPLESQLEAIRTAVAGMNAAQKVTPELRNNRRGEWPSYIRILDAIAAGATHDDIAAALYPETDNLYPYFAARQRVAKASQRADLLSRTFAIKGFSPEN